MEIPAVLRTATVCFVISSIPIGLLWWQNGVQSEAIIRLQHELDVTQVLGGPTADEVSGGNISLSPFLSALQTSPLPLEIQRREEGRMVTIWIGSEHQREKLIRDFEARPEGEMNRWTLMPTLIPGANEAAGR